MKIFGIVLLTLAVVAGVVYLSMCPCGPVPGAWLFGDEPDGKVADWSFVNDREAVPLCQVQITTWRPHSINLNCMSANQDLFISCSNCAGKNWSVDALEHPAGHIRAGGTVYPVTLKRLTSPEMLDLAWASRLNKVAGEPKPRPDHWWSFQLISR